MKFVFLCLLLVLATVSSSDRPVQILSRPRKFKRPVDPEASACGIRKVSKRKLIVGGEDTVPGEWPWQAAVYHISQGGRLREFKCGGTLITPSHVLTTASCARYGVNKTEGAIVVELGQYNLVESFQHKVDAVVSKAIVHEEYVHGETKNDVGMLELKNAVNYTDYIQPACLPLAEDKIEKFGKKVGTIVGWGFIEARTLATKLQSAQVPVIPFIECLQSDVNFFAWNLHQGMFCAGLKNGTAPCFGDAGSGMFFVDGPIWTLRGIIAFVETIYTVTGGCNTQQFVGMVDVAYFVPWIKDKIRSRNDG